jgi:hypothetical protein
MMKSNCHQQKGQTIILWGQEIKEEEEEKGLPTTNQTTTNDKRCSTRNEMQQRFQRHSRRVFLDARRCCMSHPEGIDTSYTLDCVSLCITFLFFYFLYLIKY